MAGFYENNTTGASTPTTDTTVTSDTSFYATVPGGTPVSVAPDFNGVLQPGTSHIGDVSVSNFPPSFSISNFPTTFHNIVDNFPDVQKVAVQFPAVQNVNVLNLTQDQQIHGTVSISNFPAVQAVTLTGDSVVRAGLTAGSNHIGSVSLDAPITGTVAISNLPTNQNVTVGNFPQTQNINGTISVANFPTSTKIDSSVPVGVWIKGSDVALGGGGGSGGTSFDGVITNPANKPVPVQVIGGSTFNGVLSAGTAHVGSVGIDGAVSLASGTTVNVGNLPATQNVAVQGTVPVSLQGLVALAANAAVAITSLPAITGSVAVTNLPTTQAVSLDTSTTPLNITGTVNATVAFPATQPVSLDTSTTPLRVMVTNPSAGSSFNGVLAASTANVGVVSLNFKAPDPSYGTPLNYTVPTPSTPLPTGTYFGGGSNGYTGTLVSNSAPLPVTLPTNNAYSPIYISAGTGGLGVFQASGNAWNVNVLQGGTATSKTNPIFTAPTVANAAVSTGNPLPVSVQGSVQVTVPAGVPLPVSLTTNPLSPMTVALQSSAMMLGSDPSLPRGIKAGLYDASGNAVGVGTTATVQNALSVQMPGVTMANPLPVVGSISGIANTVNVQFPLTPDVFVKGSVSIYGLDGASRVASNNPLPVAATLQGTPSVNATIQGTPSVVLIGQDGVNPASSTNPVPVSGGGSGGGTSFNGVLQAGTAHIGSVSLDGPVAMTDGYTSQSIGSMQISGGSAFTALGAAAAKRVEVTNYLGVNLEYQIGGTGSIGVIIPGMTKPFVAITNANTIALRRQDQSTTSLSFSYDLFN